MPLIKQNSAAIHTKHAVVLDLGDLRRQADRVIDTARAEAEEILASARAEAAALVASAADRGHEEGLARGMSEGRAKGHEEGKAEVLSEYRQQMEQLTVSWSEALDRWETQRGDLLLAAREDVLAFAMAVARKVIFRVAELDGSVVRDQLAEALSLLSRPTAVAIAVNPLDRPFVEDVLPDLLGRVVESGQAEVKSDESITRGGCVVRTAGGQVDATLEKQIDRIAQTLLPDDPAGAEHDR